MSALLRAVTVAKEQPNVQRIIIAAAAVQHLSSTHRPCGLHLRTTDVSPSRGHMCRISACNRPQHTPYLIVIAVIHECRKRTAPKSILHGMCRNHSKAAERLQVIKKYIQDQLATCNWDGLARALHAAQDSAAPGHRGCQPYSTYEKAPWRHRMSDAFPGPKALTEAAENTREILRQFKERCRCSAP